MPAELSGLSLFEQQGGDAVGRELRSGAYQAALDTAIEALTLVRQAVPTNAVALNNLAVALAQKGRLFEALEVLDDAAEQSVSARIDEHVAVSMLWLRPVGRGEGAFLMYWLQEASGPVIGLDESVDPEALALEPDWPGLTIVRNPAPVFALPAGDKEPSPRHQQFWEAGFTFSGAPAKMLLPDPSKTLGGPHDPWLTLRALRNDIDTLTEEYWLVTYVSANRSVVEHVSNLPTRPGEEREP